MVGVLIKYEWIRTRWWLLGGFGLTLAVMILLTLLAAIGIHGWSELAILSVFHLIPVFLGAVQIGLAVDYWRSSYVKMKYLTQTYPVKSSTIFWVKYAYSAFWVLMSFVWSVAFAILGVLAYESVPLEQVWLFLVGGVEWAAQFPLGNTVSAVTVLTLFAVLMALLPTTTYYFSISVGNEEPMSKLGIAAPIFIWLVQGIVFHVLGALAGSLIPVTAVFDETGVSLSFRSIADVMERRDPGVPIGNWLFLVVAVVGYLWRTAVSWRKVSL